jgi:hypothetical protein
MKILIKYRIEYIRSSDVQSIENGTATLVSGKSWKTMKIHSGELTEAVKNADAGQYWLQNLKFEAPVNSDFHAECIQPLIFRLKLSDGRTVLFGDKSREGELASYNNDLSIINANYERQSTTPQFS